MLLPDQHQEGQQISAYSVLSPELDNKFIGSISL